MVEICLQQQLYDGLIHVHNCSLHDYSTPLLELLLQLRATLKKYGKNLPSERVRERERSREGGRKEGRENIMLMMLPFYSDDAQKLGYKLLVYIRYVHACMRIMCACELLTWSVYMYIHCTCTCTGVVQVDWGIRLGKSHLTWSN